MEPFIVKLPSKLSEELKYGLSEYAQSKVFVDEKDDTVINYTLLNDIPLIDEYDEERQRVTYARTLKCRYSIIFLLCFCAYVSVAIMAALKSNFMPLAMSGVLIPLAAAMYSKVKSDINYHYVSGLLKTTYLLKALVDIRNYVLINDLKRTYDEIEGLKMMHDATMRAVARDAPDLAVNSINEGLEAVGKPPMLWTVDSDNIH